MHKLQLDGVAIKLSCIFWQGPDVLASLRSHDPFPIVRSRSCRCAVYSDPAVYNLIETTARVGGSFVMAGSMLATVVEL